MTSSRLTCMAFVAMMMLFGLLLYGPVSNGALNHSAGITNLSVQACDSLGTIWVEGEVVDYSSPTSWAWNGRWVRRGTSNIFDAIWIHRNGQKNVTTLTITIQGNQVRIDRPGCQYSGTLVGSGVQGTYRCERGGVNYWSANIGCEPGAGACGLGNEWRVNDTIVPGVFNPGWTGVWTRQGSSNVFASKAYRVGEPEGHATIVVTISGNQVFGQRTDEPNKYQVTDCVYEGFLIGQGGAATGTVTCNSGVGRLGPYYWDAKILCGGGNQGGGGDQGGGGGSGSAGCTGAPINWIFNVTESDKYQIGQRYMFCCNSEVGGLADVYGTDVYTSDSRVCAAALHAGVISTAGGPVTIEMRPGQKEYKSSTRNGVTTRAYGEWPASYVFVGAGSSDSAGGGVGGGDRTGRDSGGGGRCGGADQYSVTVNPLVVRAGDYVNVSFTWPNSASRYTHSYPIIFTEASAPWDSGYFYIPDVFKGIVFRTSYDSGDEQCPKKLRIGEKLPPGDYEFRLRVCPLESCVHRAKLTVLPAATSQTQRILPIDGGGSWAGRWGQALSNGAYTSTISISGNSFRASFQYQNGHSTGTGQWNCIVTGNTARGNWTESYNDPDKSVQRRGTLQVTINGDKITGQAFEDEPVFNWRTSPYSSAMRKGAVWPISLTRAR